MGGSIVQMLPLFILLQVISLLAHSYQPSNDQL